jgi:hypothetical protein
MPAIALGHHQVAAVTSSELAPMPGNAPVTGPTSRPGLPRPHGYYKLDEREGFTHLALSQDNNGSEDEAERASADWATMLGGLKKSVEGA